jgi:hypothetical protein
MKNPPENTPGDYRSLCATRHIYEVAARAGVEEIPNVEIRTCTSVTGLQWSPDKTTVTGASQLVT